MQWSSRASFVGAICSRLLAGLVGGLVLANAMAGALSLLPSHPVNAYYVTATVVTALWCGALLWAFAAKTAVRAWLGIIASALVCALAITAAKTL